MTSNPPISIADFEPLARILYSGPLTKEKAPKARNYGDIPVGYGECLSMDWKECQNEDVSIDMQSSPSISNPAHASIKYYFQNKRIKGKHGAFQEPSFQEFLTELSVSHTFVPFI